MRLNPKLTKRAQASTMQTLNISGNRSLSTGGETEPDASTGRSGDSEVSASSDSTTTSSDTDTKSVTASTIQNVTNPRLHLLHNGKWIPKEYVIGRWKPGTGLWDCCGHIEHLSMYCESLEQRDLFRAQVTREVTKAQEDKDLRYARREEMQKHVQWSKDHEKPDPNSKKKKQVIPSYNIYSSITESETQAKIDLATSSEHSYNAPMLVSWLLRHCQEEETVIQGLNQAYKHLQTTEGCLLLARHDLHNTLYRIANHFLSWQPDIVHLCLQCLRQLVDCNATRDMVLNPIVGDSDTPAGNGSVANNARPDAGGSLTTGTIGLDTVSVTNTALSQSLMNGNATSASSSVLSHMTPPSDNLDSPTVRCTMLVCEILMRYGRLSAEQITLTHQLSLKYPQKVIEEKEETEDESEKRKKEVDAVKNHLFQGKKPMTMTPAALTSNILEHCIRCLMQASRYEAHRIVLFDLRIYHYTKSFVLSCYKECGAEIIHAYLRFLHWSASTIPRTAFFYEELKALKILLKCFKVYATEVRVLVPAIILLHWLVSQLPSAFQAALDANLIASVVASLKYVYNDELTQLAALKLIQLLAKTSQGFVQLENIRGAWQELTQGTIIGEELVHQLPGPLHNKGWSIGEAPFRPLRELQGEQSRVLAQTALQQAPKSSWTAHSLRQYMGLSLSGQKLAINTEESIVFFELLTTLDMLPASGEIKEDWFKRLRKYEQESELSIHEMVETVQEMRRREKIRQQMQKQGLIVGLEGLQMSSLGNFTAKELYVRGKEVKAETLQENDADIEDAMNGGI